MAFPTTTVAWVFGRRAEIMGLDPDHPWARNEVGLTGGNMYDLREQGITAPQEVAFGFGIAMCYMDELIRRGLDRRISWERSH